MRWVCQVVWIQLFEPALQPNHEPLPSICLLKWARSTSDIWENLQLGPKSQNPMGKRTMQMDCEENTKLCSLFFYYELKRSRYLFAGTFCRVFSPAHRAEWLQNLKKKNIVFWKHHVSKIKNCAFALTGLVSEVAQPSAAGWAHLWSCQTKPSWLGDAEHRSGVFFCCACCPGRIGHSSRRSISSPWQRRNPSTKKKKKTPLQTRLKNTRKGNVTFAFCLRGSRKKCKLLTVLSKRESSVLHVGYIKQFGGVGGTVIYKCKLCQY